MAPSPGLLLRTTRPAWHLFVPILVLRLQPSSLWWSQPLPRTAACPLFIFHPPPAFPQPEAKARGHTDIEHPVARNAASCCVGAGAALASFACPLAPSNSLFSSAAASGLGRVAPTRAAHWGGPESLAHLWRGKGHHLASHNLHACSVGFQLARSSGPGLGHGRTLLAPCNGMCQLPGSIPTAALAVLFAVSMSPKPTGSTHAAIPMDTDGLQLLYIPFSHPSCQDCHPAACPYSAARHAWAQVLTRACATVAHRNDRKAWHELCMLPKCVLCTPTRGGRQHRKATGTHLGPLAPLAGGGTAIPLGLPYCVAAGAWTA